MDVDLDRATGLLDESDIAHWELYSDLLYMKGKKNVLKDFASRCVKQKGWCRETCYVLGNLYSLLQRHDSALSWFRRAIAIDPDYEAALILFGNEHLEMKTPNEAIQAYAAAASSHKVTPISSAYTFD